MRNVNNKTHSCYFSGNMVHKACKIICVLGHAAPITRTLPSWTFVLFPDVRSCTYVLLFHSKADQFSGNRRNTVCV